VLKFIPSHDRRFDIDAFVKAITPRTKVLTVSFVQFFNGFKNDLEALGKICRERGIYFVVDGIQGMGAETINMREANIDIFASGCQKWMLSPQGCGFFFISDSVRPTLKLPFGTWLGVEWGVKFTDVFYYDKPWFDSARRFEMGYYAVWNILAMKEAVKIFQMLGIDNIQRHNHALIDRLVAYLRGNAFYTITSTLEEKHRSSIFTFSCADVPRLHRFILDNKIILVEREGSIRVSAHLFNNEADIDRLIDALDRFAKHA
jgi:selenocysteine lyase/cysteine desulfurase